MAHSCSATDFLPPEVPTYQHSNLIGVVPQWAVSTVVIIIPLICALLVLIARLNMGRRVEWNGVFWVMGKVKYKETFQN